MISGIIITFNEEEKIADALLSLQSVCDEIIIVDAESTDKTTTVAERLGAKIEIRKWAGYGQARNYGAQMAKNNWILSMDADERLDEILIESIKKLKLNNNYNYAFQLMTKYGNQWIRYGALHPKWKTRLYHRQRSEWSEPMVHETLVPQSTGSNTRTIRLEGHLLHYAYSGRAELSERLNDYAHLVAKQWASEKYTPSWPKVHLGSLYHFMRSYIWKFGFLDGKAGWEIAGELSRYHSTKLRYLRVGTTQVS